MAVLEQDMVMMVEMELLMNMLAVAVLVVMVEMALVRRPQVLVVLVYK